MIFQSDYFSVYLGRSLLPFKHFIDPRQALLHDRLKETSRENSPCLKLLPETFIIPASSNGVTFVILNNDYLNERDNELKKRFYKKNKLSYLEISLQVR